MRTAILLALLATGCPTAPPEQPTEKTPFQVVAETLAHPRCTNCHPAGDQPLIGEDSRPHGMQVMRGPEGRGITTTMCSNCHQPENLEGEHMPPGAPDWRMPSQDTPMVFEGKSASELCKAITDPTVNGGKSLPELLEHLESDPFVQWGWTPGDGRAPAPGSHGTFAAAARTWIQSGARCD